MSYTEKQRQRNKIRWEKNKKEILKRLQDYRLKHPKRSREKARKRQEKYRIKLRSLVLQKLGNKCSSCGISDKRVLQVDHINGEGSLERKTSQYNPRAFNKKIVKDSTPYQLLCANCNWIKRWENKEF